VGKCGGRLPKLRRLIKRALLCLAVLTVFIPPVQASAAPDWKCPQWHALFRKHKLPIAWADRICWRESRGIAQAIGWNYRKGMDHTNCVLSPAPTYKNCSAVRSYDVGIMQINSGHRSLTARVCKRPRRQLIRSLTDPSCNLKVASVLWDNGKGAAHWRATSGK
jgi:hypothetical protein